MNLALDKNFAYYLNNDFKGYHDGEWIAIHGQKVVAHGKKLKEVIYKAKKIAPLSKILVSKIAKTPYYLGH